MTDERRAFIHGLCRGGLYGYVVGGCVFAVLIAAFGPLIRSNCRSRNWRN